MTQEKNTYTNSHNYSPCIPQWGMNVEQLLNELVEDGLPYHMVNDLDPRRRINGGHNAISFQAEGVNSNDTNNVKKFPQGGTEPRKKYEMRTQDEDNNILKIEPLPKYLKDRPDPPSGSALGFLFTTTVAMNNERKREDMLKGVANWIERNEALKKAFNTLTRYRHLSVENLSKSLEISKEEAEEILSHILDADLLMKVREKWTVNRDSLDLLEIINLD